MFFACDCGETNNKQCATCIPCYSNNNGSIKIYVIINIAHTKNKMNNRESTGAERWDTYKKKWKMSRASNQIKRLYTKRLKLIKSRINKQLLTLRNWLEYRAADWVSGTEYGSAIMFWYFQLLYFIIFIGVNKWKSYPAMITIITMTKDGY